MTAVPCSSLRDKKTREAAPRSLITRNILTESTVLKRLMMKDESERIGSSLLSLMKQGVIPDVYQRAILEGVGGARPDINLPPLVGSHYSEYVSQIAPLSDGVVNLLVAAMLIPVVVNFIRSPQPVVSLYRSLPSRRRVQKRLTTPPPLLHGRLAVLSQHPKYWSLAEKMQRYSPPKKKKPLPSKEIRPTFPLRIYLHQSDQL